MLATQVGKDNIRFITYNSQIMSRYIKEVKVKIKTSKVVHRKYGRIFVWP